MTPPSDQPPDKPPIMTPGVAELATVMLTVIDLESYKVLFQNQASISKFGNISNLTCHENIAG